MPKNRQFQNWLYFISIYNKGELKRNKSNYESESNILLWFIEKCESKSDMLWEFKSKKNYQSNINSLNKNSNLILKTINK